MVFPQLSFNWVNPSQSRSRIGVSTVRAPSHYTISVVRRIRLDAICHEGPSQVIVADDWHHLTLHDWFPTIAYNLTIYRDVSDICSKRYDGLRYPPIVRIAADRIAEGLTLHDILSAMASWGAIAGRRKLKIV